MSWVLVEGPGRCYRARRGVPLASSGVPAGPWLARFIMAGWWRREGRRVPAHLSLRTPTFPPKYRLQSKYLPRIEYTGRFTSGPCFPVVSERQITEAIEESCEAV